MGGVGWWMGIVSTERGLLQLECSSAGQLAILLPGVRQGGEEGASAPWRAVVRVTGWQDGSSGPRLSLETQSLLEPGKEGGCIRAGKPTLLLEDGHQSV